MSSNKNYKSKTIKNKKPLSTLLTASCVVKHYISHEALSHLLYDSSHVITNYGFLLVAMEA